MDTDPQQQEAASPLMLVVRSSLRLGIASIVLRTILILVTGVALWTHTAAATIEFTLVDEARQRPVPVTVFEPPQSACQSGCAVAVFGTGYGASAAEYSFLLSALAAAGFFAVGIQHDLPADPPMTNTGDVVRDRSPFWLRGAQTIEFSIKALASRFPQHAWATPILIGHSQGGDIAALLTAQRTLAIRALVTLDNRRVAFPHSGEPPTLTLRSSDQQADPGVLPDPKKNHPQSACIVRLADTRHDDMNDGATADSKKTIVDATLNFLRHGQCTKSDAYR